MSRPPKLASKKALITGASRGIGAAIAHAFAEEGADVAFCHVDDEAGAASVVANVQQLGQRAFAYHCDIADAAAARSFFIDAEAALGQIDILVNNAGIAGPAAYIWDQTDEDWQRNIAINLTGVFNFCRAVIPHMRKRGWGRIVAITSIAAKQPVENLILSNTARAGVLGFMKSLSQQVASEGITVNTVCPGYHLTERLKNLSSQIAQKEGVSVEEVYARWAASTPMKRIGDPAEFAAVVAFACSERASYLTGSVIQIDGGAYRALY